MSSGTRRVKKYNEEKDVLQAGRERMDYLFENFDELWVSFSGGKDSGAVLNLVLDAVERHGELPGEKKIQVLHFDDEFAYPETEEFTNKIVREFQDELHIWWLCFPMKYGGGTNRTDKYFTPWNPSMKDRWIREKPSPDRHPNMTMMDRRHEWYQEHVDASMKHKDIAPLLIEENRDGRAASLTGIRTNESMNRYTALMRAGTWLKGYGQGRDHRVAYPIYDWTDRDLWKIHNDEGWEYNRAYDKLQQLGYAPRTMRTAHPFHYMSLTAGSDNSSEAATQKQMWPEEYVRWARRLEGAQLAFDYGGKYAGPVSPPGMNNEEYTHLLLENIEDEDLYEKCRRQIQKRINNHADHSDEPLRQWRPCPVCNLRWWDMVNYVYEKKYDIVLGQTG